MDIKILNILKTVKQLEESMNSWEKKKQASRCDKLRVGFNQDPRFKGPELKLSLDSWSGYYGSSSCARFFYVGDDATFNNALLSILNKHIKQILTWTLEELKSQRAIYKDAVQTSIDSQIKELESWGD